MNDLEILVSINASERVGCVTLRRLLDRFGSLGAVEGASERAIAEVQGVGPAAASDIRRVLADRRGVRELEDAKRFGVRLIAYDDPETPPGFKLLYDAPLILYVRGTLLPEDAAAVSIVGTREATSYGLNAAERLAHNLAMAGMTVVSGLARGIDTAAHRGALRAGRTIAVLGSGVLRVYPEDNDTLARRIVARGCLLSEFPLRAEPNAVHFPRRNRLIAALGLGTVVVESGESSGALITADWAIEQGKEVFAVPGPITSTASLGCHNLIKQGAKLAASADDILEEIGFARSSIPLSREEDRLLEALRSGPRASHELADETGLGVGDVEQALGGLVKRGKAKREGEAYVRA
ncbi:MAG: DNA-processing protein DprA [Planctomycetes bacterium]|nr:DNA-processing protein DprA [Planctomycetota bacterium]